MPNANEEFIVEMQMGCLANRDASPWRAVGARLRSVGRL